MNANPEPEGQSHLPLCGAGGTQAPLLAEPRSVPRQQKGGQAAERLLGAAADLLEHPDPGIAAQGAAVENLLRCWVRENGLAAPEQGTLRIPLEASGTVLLVPVGYWSASGWHRFGLPYLEDSRDSAPSVDAVTVAALLARECLRGSAVVAAHTGGDAAEEPEDSGGAEAESAGGLARSAGGPPGETTRTVEDVPAAGDVPVGEDFPVARDVPGGQAASVAPEVPAVREAPAVQLGDGGDLVGRIADSVRRTAVFIADRRKSPGDAADLFLAAEQALLLGHPLHPAPKSREGLTEAESRLYSPELRGSFPLHWMALAPSVLATDSAWTERGRAVPAAQLTAFLAGDRLPLPDGYTALPMHPWQLREVIHRPETGELLEAGLLKDLGPHGSPWHPTSSVRTVYRSGAPVMLKLSLGLRITNSRRENLRKELHRGVEVHRLLRSGLAEQWQQAHPGFDIVRDPAWLAVNGPDGAALPGLDVMIRHSPFGPADDVSCIAGLVSPRPPVQPAGQDRTPMRSRLTELVTRLAGRTGRPRGAVAAEWFLRYLQQVVRPVLWLDSEAGVALEAHQQNTLVLLDPDGWPIGGRYRDNQGYYFRESRRDELDKRLPGIGELSDTFVSDAVTDERFAYYLAINNVLGLIGAFGSQRLAEEQLLLAAFRTFLRDVATGPGSLRTPIPEQLLDSPVLRCKANLLTRAHGLDELVGPVDTQSVYVTIANPLHS